MKKRDNKTRDKSFVSTEAESARQDNSPSQSLQETNIHNSTNKTADDILLAALNIELDSDVSFSESPSSTTSSVSANSSHSHNASMHSLADSDHSAIQISDSNSSSEANQAEVLHHIGELPNYVIESDEEYYVTSATPSSVRATSSSSMTVNLPSPHWDLDVLPSPDLSRLSPPDSAASFYASLSSICSTTNHIAFSDAYNETSDLHNAFSVSPAMMPSYNDQLQIHIQTANQVLAHHPSILISPSLSISDDSNSIVRHSRSAWEDTPTSTGTNESISSDDKATLQVSNNEVATVLHQMVEKTISDSESDMEISFALEEEEAKNFSPYAERNIELQAYTSSLDVAERSVDVLSQPPKSATRLVPPDWEIVKGIHSHEPASNDFVEMKFPDHEIIASEIEIPAEDNDFVIVESAENVTQQQQAINIAQVPQCTTTDRFFNGLCGFFALRQPASPKSSPEVEKEARISLCCKMW